MPKQIRHDNLFAFMREHDWPEYPGPGDLKIKEVSAVAAELAASLNVVTTAIDEFHSRLILRSQVSHDSIRIDG